MCRFVDYFERTASKACHGTVALRSMAAGSSLGNAFAHITAIIRFRRNLIAIHYLAWTAAGAVRF
jgi:hypothetical protein